MDAKIVMMRSFPDKRGTLSVGELGKEMPFPVKRIYYIYGVPSKDIRRGYHSHKALRQLCLCTSGSCTMMLDDGKERCDFVLDSPDKALYIGPGIWREMYDFSEDAVLMVLASEEYSEDDYIRDYDEFIESKRD